MRLRWSAVSLALMAWLMATQAMADGQVRVYVFDGDGGPLLGAVVAVEGAPPVVTGGSGLQILTLEAGAWAMEVEPPAGRDALTPARIPEVAVVDGEVTEIIVSLRAGVAEVDIEAPPLPESRVEAPSTERAEERPGEPAPSGTLTGVCQDDSGNGVRQVQIFVRGRDETVTSGPGGRFSIELPQGTHALSFIHPRYAAASLDGVEIVADEPAEVVIALTPVSLALEDFVVTAPYIEGGVAGLVAERRQAANVSDMLGAEQMSKAGDSSAASAVRRVTGVTIVDGRYIFIRGMGERYASTLLNGMYLPSPEPERRVVPLDMFPTGILSSVEIQKSYSPDKPGEFGGGVLDLKTRRLPEARYLELSSTLGALLGTTGHGGLTYAGGGTDWLGVDDGTRAIPEQLAQATEANGLKGCGISQEGCITPEERAELGRSLPEGWSTERMTVPPNVGLTVAGGDVFAWRDLKFGGVSSVSYSQSWARQSRSRNIYRAVDSDEGDIELDFREGGVVDQLTRTIMFSGILELGLDVGRAHRFATTSLLLRHSEDETGQFTGTNAGERNDVDVRRLRWVERQLFVQQLRGESDLPVLDAQLTWRYGYALAERSEPNRRIYQYDRGIGDDEPFASSAKPENNRRFFSDLEDASHELAAELLVPILPGIKKSAPHRLAVRLGGLVVRRERDVQSRRYRFTGPTRLTEGVDEVLARENIGSAPGQFSIINTTQATDDYVAHQDIEAGYLIGDVALPGEVRVSAGARVERSKQSVVTSSPFSAGEPVEASLDNTDVLPSALITWGFLDDMQLRLGYGQTVNRPEFREMSPARFDDVTNGRSFKGNPELQRASITHYDLRWEWYLSPQETLSAGVFYKRIDDPIEPTIEPGADQSLFPQNAPASAENLGVEIEARKGLGFLTESLQGYVISGNLALIDSTVDLGEDRGLLTSRTRSLVGQSPFVLNLQFGYDDPEAGTYWTLLYNAFGRRVDTVGTSPKPDWFDEDRHYVDVVFGYQLDERLSLKAKAGNLLDTPVRGTQLDQPLGRFQAGRSLSVGLKWEAL